VEPQFFAATVRALEQVDASISPVPEMGDLISGPHHNARRAVVSS
jgi:hypothetical protein